MKKILSNINLKVFFALLLLVAAVYSKSLFFDFTYLDDDVLIIDKQEYLQISNIKNIFSDTVFAQGMDKYYRPVLNVSFMMDSFVGVIDPFVYHLTNIVIHLIAAYMIFIFLSFQYDKKTVFLLCSLFAAHPALSQAVVWIPGRNDSLLTLFSVASFYFLIRYFNYKKKYNLFLHVVLFIIALYTKETALIMAVLFFLYVYGRYKNKGNLHLYALWIMSVFLYFISRYFVFQYQSSSIDISILFESLISSLPVTIKYFTNILLPLNLSVFPADINLNYILFFTVSAIIALLFYISGSKYDKKTVFFGFLWFIICLLPTYILPNNQYYEHRLYLPMIGLFIVILELTKSYTKKQKQYLIGIGIFLILLFSMLSYVHIQKFKNRMYFWTNALIDSPDSGIVNSNIASIFDEFGEYEQAETNYLKAISSDKNDSRHYVNLAVLYIKLNKMREAEEYLHKALEINAENETAYYNLAVLYNRTDQTDLAEKMKEKYLEFVKMNNRYEKP